MKTLETPILLKNGQYWLNPTMKNLRNCAPYNEWQVLFTTSHHEVQQIWNVAVSEHVQMYKGDLFWGEAPTWFRQMSAASCSYWMQTFCSLAAPKCFWLFRFVKLNKNTIHSIIKSLSNFRLKLAFIWIRASNFEIQVFILAIFPIGQWAQRTLVNTECVSDFSI